MLSLFFLLYTDNENLMDSEVSQSDKDNYLYVKFILFSLYFV
jgi:hypothetical protein